jgi:putative chitinase
VKNPEALANHVYASTDGNSEPGDGWKYRGRGFLQITGKNAYKSLGDYLKIDLISNPDLLNTPEIAAKSIPWFFLVYKKYLTKGGQNSLEDISGVNKAVAFSDPKGEKGRFRAELSNNMLTELSSENSELRKQMGAATPGTQTTNNVNVAPGATTTQQQNRAVVDDSSPYSRKSKQ